MSNILDLHRAATVRGRIGYGERMKRYAALAEAAAALCAKLPFSWHAVAMDNPTQNHTGTTNGRGHIVLDDEYHAGQLHRKAGYALCGGDSANLWGDAESVTCKRCLEMAQRIVSK